MDGKESQDPLHILTTVSLQTDEIRARLRNIPITDQQSENQIEETSTQQLVCSSMYLLILCYYVLSAKMFSTH